MRRNCGLLLFRDISGLNETELQEKREAIKRETKDQWNKIEFAIADIKYLFLGSMLPVLDTLKATMSSLSSHKEFFLKINNILK
jgi:hypothetical protein